MPNKIVTIMTVNKRISRIFLYMGTIFSHTYLYNPSLNQSSAENLIIRVIYVVFTLGPFGLRGKGGEVEGSRVKLAENC